VANDPSNAQPPAPPKRRRLRGELYTCLRLIPYMRPFTWGIALLVLVTFVHASANAARAWLIAPLFNQILLRGSAVVDHMRDQELADAAPKAAADLAVIAAVSSFDESKADEAMDGEDYGMGRAPITHSSPYEVKKDELALLLMRTRGAIIAGVDQLSQLGRPVDQSGPWWKRAYHFVKDGVKLEVTPDAAKIEKLKRRLYKSIVLEAYAENLVGKEKLLGASSSRSSGTTSSSSSSRRSSSRSCSARSTSSSTTSRARSRRAWSSTSRTASPSTC
jgi:hypothetical protein